MHLPQSGDSWKADLKSDSGLEEVIAEAQKDDSLSILNGGDVDGALSRMEQAGPEHALTTIQSVSIIT